MEENITNASTHHKFIKEIYEIIKIKYMIFKKYIINHLTIKK